MSPAGDTRLRRIVEILEALGTPEAAREGGLGVVRVAELVGREKSLVSRALGALAAERLVERDPRLEVARRELGRLMEADR